MSPSFLFSRLGIPRSSPIYHVTSFQIFVYHMKSYRIPTNLGLALEWVLISGDSWNDIVFTKLITNIQIFRLNLECPLNRTSFKGGRKVSLQTPVLHGSYF